MSRQSAEALTLVPVTPWSGHPVPADLTEAESVLWREVIDSKPREWFGVDSLPVLKEFVRACAACDVLAPLVEKALASGKSKDMRDLMDIRNKEANRAAALATKLRLTQQSRYTPQASATANRKASGRKPWES